MRHLRLFVALLLVSYQTEDLSAQFGECLPQTPCDTVTTWGDGITPMYTCTWYDPQFGCGGGCVTGSCVMNPDPQAPF